VGEDWVVDYNALDCGIIVGGQDCLFDFLFGNDTEVEKEATGEILACESRITSSADRMESLSHVIQGEINPNRGRAIDYPGSPRRIHAIPRP